MSAPSKIWLPCCLFCPISFFSATAGQLADKYERAQLVRAIKLLEIIIMLIATAGFLLGSLWLLLTALFLMGAQSTFFGPIKYAILPEVLKPHEMMSGNAIFQSGTSIAILFKDDSRRCSDFSICRKFSLD